MPANESSSAGHPRSGGFLTEEQEAYLANDLAETDHERVREELLGNLRTTLGQLRNVWYQLSDDDLEAAFDATNDITPRYTPHTSEIIALLAHAEYQHGHNVAHSIKAGINMANAAHGRHGTVTLEIETSAMHSPAEAMSLLEQGDRDELSITEYVHLLTAPHISPARIAEWDAARDVDADIETTADEIRTLRESRSGIAKRRLPTVVGVNHPKHSDTLLGQVIPDEVHHETEASNEQENPR